MRWLTLIMLSLEFEIETDSKLPFYLNNTLFMTFFLMFQALLPHLFMIFYVNGVNQVFDFEIDKVWNLL